MIEEDLIIDSEHAKNFWFEQNKKYMGWKNKACVYHRAIFEKINVPDRGDCVQLGTGFAMSLEILSHRFPGRTWGIDLLNYMEHPLVRTIDIRELEDIKLAYVHCNIGHFESTPKIRKFALEYSLKNLVSGGFCLTAGNHEFVEKQLGFTIKSLADKFQCDVLPLPTCGEIANMNAQGRFNSAHDCLIKKR